MPTAPTGVKQTQYTNPTPDMRYWTSAQAAQMPMGQVPQLANNFRNAQAAQLGQTADMGQSRQGMWDQLAQLRAQSQGQGLLAPLMMQQNQDATLQNLMRVNAQNRSTAGGSAYSGQAGVLGLNLQGQQQAAQQAAQERLNAQGQIAGMLQGIYGQDAEQMARNADYQQQANMYNAQGRNGMMQSDADRYMQALMQNGQWQQQANMQNGMGMMQYGGLLSGDNKWTQEMNAKYQDMLNQYFLQRQLGTDASNLNLRNQVIGNGVQGIASMASKAGGIG